MADLLEKPLELHRRGIELPARLTREDQRRILAGEWPEASGPRVERQGWPAKRGRGGRREDLGIYVRSTMEANLIRLLRFHGHEVHYEPQHWLLRFPVPRGVIEYRPDLLVRPGFFVRGAPEELIEAKGWMDPRSKTALRRVDRYYGDRIQVLYDPTVWDGQRMPLVVVDERRYVEATRGAAGVIPGWE